MTPDPCPILSFNPVDGKKFRPGRRFFRQGPLCLCAGEGPLCHDPGTACHDLCHDLKLIKRPSLLGCHDVTTCTPWEGYHSQTSG